MWIDSYCNIGFPTWQFLVEEVDACATYSNTGWQWGHCEMTSSKFIRNIILLCNLKSVITLRETQLNENVYSFVDIQYMLHHVHHIMVKSGTAQLCITLFFGVSLVYSLTHSLTHLTLHDLMSNSCNVFLNMLATCIYH